MRKTPQKALWIGEDIHKEFTEWAEGEHRTAKAQFELLWEETKKKLKRKKSKLNDSDANK